MHETHASTVVASLFVWPKAGLVVLHGASL
jgi:hypothetical protein